jgi:quinol monooxygenase YgiN
MNKILFSAAFTVPAEALDEFKKLGEILIQRVKDTEPTTEEYLWYCDAEQVEWEVRETYPDSAAALAHVQNMGAELQRAMEIATLDLRIYGPASEELQGLARQVGAKVFGCDGGFAR